MPTCFQKAFGKKVAVIIDCFEIFVECPSNLQVHAMTWSTMMLSKYLWELVFRGSIICFRELG